MSDSLVKLPSWVEPKNLEKAKQEILNLGQGLHAHAYLVGKHLIWVKSQLKHGEFLPWLEREVAMSQRAAYYWVSFAVKCDESKRLLPAVTDKIAKIANLKVPPLPDGKFRVLYADPPWAYDNSGFHQSAASIYPTMSTDEIIAKVPVAQLLGDHAVLFLWVTSPILPDGLRLMSAWGFTYKASIIWDKGKAPGMGWWVRTKHELLLIGSKGDVGTPREMPDSIFHDPPEQHSRKPGRVRGMIELMFPGPYIELFARERVEGWSAWGNEI